LADVKGFVTPQKNTCGFKSPCKLGTLGDFSGKRENLLTRTLNKDMLFGGQKQKND